MVKHVSMSRPRWGGAALVLGCALLGGNLVAQSLPKGYWELEQSRAILEKTLTLRLDPDLSHLNSNEREAVGQLLAAGEILHRLYERQKHPQAEDAAERLAELDRKLGAPESTRNLRDLYRLFKGPIGTTLENQREAFVPVSEEVPGRNVYPAGTTKEELDAFLQTHPESRDRLLHVRSVVRRATADGPARDLEVLRRHPVLDRLHPGLKDRLSSLGGTNGKGFYAAPYSVAYADEILEVFDRLNNAATSLAEEDPDFAGYLRHRARDLLADDYEAGDASWVTGRFGNLNAQIGSYETYDDKLYGVKSFFSLSLLVRDPEQSARLARALAGIQKIEDALPYARPKQVRGNIPVGVYNIVADFGQARGGNTATILPNEAAHARKYGRTILLRYNIMTDPDRFEAASVRFAAAVAPGVRDHLTLQGGFERTLWHEVGHYLGVDTTDDGRTLDEALEQYSNLLEEMKSDLVSLFAAAALHEDGYYDASALRAIYAGGILRVLQVVKPRRTQPYQTMQLMQWNWFLEHGVLAFDEGSGTLAIDYERYPAAVESLLREVLALQAAGDPEGAAAFVERWGEWKDDLHERVAANIREAVRYRYTLVRYAAID
jgi:hypothetical protein